MVQSHWGEIGGYLIGASVAGATYAGAETLLRNQTAINPWLTAAGKLFIGAGIVWANHEYISDEFNLIDVAALGFGISAFQDVLQATGHRVTPQTQFNIV